MKTCSLCGEAKSLDEFYRCRTSADGRRGKCKVCWKADCAAYQKANRDKGTEKARRWRAANPERSREATRRYESRNPDKWRERYERRYAEKGPAAFAEANRRRRAMKNAAPLALIAQSSKVVEQDTGSACYWCGTTEGPFHRDHVLPLTKGGAHCEENLVWSCQSCNQRKHAKHPLRWIAEQVAA